MDSDIGGHGRVPSEADQSPHKSDHSSPEGIFAFPTHSIGGLPERPRPFGSCQRIRCPHRTVARANPIPAPTTMTGQTPDSTNPDATEHHALNAVLHATGAETGFWDDDGRPAPCPTTSMSGPRKPCWTLALPVSERQPDQRSRQRTSGTHDGRG
jgi:hypothetical protein